MPASQRCSTASWGSPGWMAITSWAFCWFLCVAHLPSCLCGAGLMEKLSKLGRYSRTGWWGNTGLQDLGVTHTQSFTQTPGTTFLSIAFHSFERVVFDFKVEMDLTTSLLLVESSVAWKVGSS